MFCILKIGVLQVTEYEMAKKHNLKYLTEVPDLNG